MAPLRMLRTIERAPRARYTQIGKPAVSLLVEFPADVRIWGSTLMEYRPRLSPLTVRKASQMFDRRFKRVKLTSNGRRIAPNGVQLSSLQPQLAGRDLYIAAPPRSGKTLLYLLPEAIRRAYLDRNLSNDEAYKTLVLVPTLDLVLLGCRSASGVLRQTSNVKGLHYKHVADGTYEDIIKTADVIYTTPHCAFKVMLKAPTLLEAVRLLILDEAHRLLKAQSAYKVMRLKVLLKPDIQTVALAPRNDAMLRQFLSRAFRVDMKIISYTPDYDGSKVRQHIRGPQRSEAFDVVKNLNIENDSSVVPMTEIDQKVKHNRNKIIEHSKSKELFVHRDFRCEYLLYSPSKLCQMLHAVLSQGKKLLLFFPTVRMAQFCYIYFKHLIGIERTLYALHGGLSPEKRRFVVDIFSSMNDGVLFCTDLASLGLNLGNIDLVVQIGAAESVDTLADRVTLCNKGDKASKSILLLHDLDAHVLYEASEHNCEIKPTEDEFYKTTSFKPNKSWVNNRSYLASCELMYRSLLGYYCNHANRLMFQRWQVPSLVYELVRSFGYSDNFVVTKQFTSRLQLWDAPGLVVDNRSVRKTELQAAAAGYPGFRSKFMQTNAASVDELVIR